MVGLNYFTPTREAASILEIFCLTPNINILYFMIFYMSIGNDNSFFLLFSVKCW